MSTNGPMDERNIVLIGYRGAGKTTVGRLVAQQLGRPFIDTDQRIESEAGRSIANIFAADGEPAFRLLERDVIAEVTKLRNQVIAVGGGAIIDTKNRTNLAAAGWIVYLTAPPEQLWERIQSDPGTASARPNLTETGGLGEIRTILAQRDPVYRQSADAIIETLSQTPPNTAQSIIHALEEHPI